MKAWLLTEFGKPFELVNLPDPTAGPGEVVVDIRAAGLCHSDIAISDGTMPTMAQPPVIIGHEIAGIVSQIGDGVTGVAVGDRVGIDPLASGLTGPDARTGGGYAEKTTAKPHELIPMPDRVSFEQAAAGTDAGSTAHKAVRRTGGVGVGTRVGIVGLGGLGLTGARIAALAGAEVYAAEIDEDIFPTAQAAGVRKCFTEVAALTPLELDVIIDFAGMNTTAAAIEAVKPGGLVVQVGLGQPEASISLFSLVFAEKRLIGSLAGSVQDSIELYRLIDRGELELATRVIGFGDINDGLDSLRNGDVHGERLVAVFGG